MATSGYSGTPLAKKLGIVEGMVIAVTHWAEIPLAPYENEEGA